MDYRLKIDEEVIALQAEKKKDGSMVLSHAGRTFEIEYTMVSEYHQHLTIDGRPLNVFIAGDGNSKMVVIRGTPYYIADADAVENRSRGKKRDQVMPQEVTPPMPAVVVRILVSEGDEVKKGDSVIVVSSMKMESTLVAPADGRVKKINVAEGDKVMPGQILIDIDRDAAALPRE
ncbi:MAG: acetyl-CoA carboxylase biotin carboxyl carrier protein subunit [Dehalococcoidia bacterium]|jgi:biotin carboxyl carrier protein